jgi:hypothetical protein
MRTLFITLVAGLAVAACNSDTEAVGTALPAPTDLSSVSLNRAVALDWADNAFQTAPARFSIYRVYSTSYDLDRGLCGTRWDLEGSSVAPEFLVGGLTNGVPRCYGVAALSTDGVEGDWSPLRQDTPRPDARNVLVYAFATKPDSSGFIFWSDDNGNGTGDPAELGLIEYAGAAVDFAVHRSADSSLWIVPMFTGTTMRPYGRVSDLTGIDFAPAGGYSRDSLQAQVGYGYVFQIIDGSALNYAALRVSHVGRQYLIFDWSVQTDVGNPELIVRGGLLTAPLTASAVARPK